MGLRPQHIAGRTWHGRRGAIGNRFSYGVDYVLIDAEDIDAKTGQDGPALFSRNRGNLTSLHDVDHGGIRGAGRGAAWVRDVIAREGLGDLADGPIHLLAQPRVLGHVFNPVCFWLLHDRAGALRAVMSEVNNTFGDRHSYLSMRADGGEITEQDTLHARKLMHVSPFQEVTGDYTFRFAIDPDRIAITIDYRGNDGEGVVATLTGSRRPLTNRAILGACLRRPFGSRRVLALIFWQAALLRLKGARYLRRPAPPKHDLSR